MTHHATRQLAEFVVSTSLSHLPDEVVDRAKYFVLDYLGVALRGSRVDSSAAIQAFVERFAPPGHATIIGCDHGAHPAYAALANGAAAHGIEMDDTHQEGSIHLGASVISALLAASEMQPAGGGEFLAAVVLGYEVAAWLALRRTTGAAFIRPARAVRLAPLRPWRVCGAWRRGAWRGHLALPAARRQGPWNFWPRAPGPNASTPAGRPTTG